MRSLQLLIRLDCALMHQSSEFQGERGGSRSQFRLCSLLIYFLEVLSKARQSENGRYLLIQFGIYADVHGWLGPVGPEK